MEYVERRVQNERKARQRYVNSVLLHCTAARLERRLGALRNRPVPPGHPVRVPVRSYSPALKLLEAVLAVSVAGYSLLSIPAESTAESIVDAHALRQVRNDRSIVCNSKSCGLQAHNADSAFISTVSARAMAAAAQ